MNNDVKVKNVFIDTNIFLDFYRLSEKDLKELEKLIDSIKKEEVKLFLTKQVKQEFERKREDVFSQTFNKLSSAKEDEAFPHIFELNNILKNYPEYSSVRKAKVVLEKIKSQLIEKLQKDIIEKNLIADKLIDDIFDKSGVIDSDKYLEKAEKRIKFGNPPGKKGGCGDAINWEVIIDLVPEKKDLFLISCDSDFTSVMDGSRIHPFLSDEWKKLKESRIYLYDSLSEFFSKHNLDIELEENSRKDDLIEKLNLSANFTTTHNVISKLSRYTYFEDYQIKSLAKALLENSQVRWISDDSDVKGFYKSVMKDRLHIFDDNEKSVLESHIFPEHNEANKEIDDAIKALSENIDLDNFEEVPF